MARKINEISGMPQVQTALEGWEVNLTLVRVVQTIVDGFPVDQENRTPFRGTVQPLSPEEIMQKPEGQRSWQWLQIHVFSGETNLRANDVIEYNAIAYKVMGVKDYSINGYVEYHVVEDFQA